VIGSWQVRPTAPDVTAKANLDKRYVLPLAFSCLFPSTPLLIIFCLLFPTAEASARIWRCIGRVTSLGGSRLAQRSSHPSPYSSFSDVLVGR
jgi:hypothetical protein